MAEKPRPGDEAGVWCQMVGEVRKREYLKRDSTLDVTSIREPHNLKGIKTYHNPTEGITPNELLLPDLIILVPSVLSLS
jgi:hypothetical protein